MTISYYLLGCRGDRFDLCDPVSPIRLVDDPDGLEGAPHDPAYQENVNQGGSYYKGQQDKPNDISLRLRIGGHDYPGDADDLHTAVTAWRRNIGAGPQVSELHVVDDVIGTDRWQWVRYNGRDNGIPRARLAAFGFSGVFTMTLTSDSSWWNSDPVELDALTETSVHNSGWFAAWPQWEITGPTTGLKIGLGGEQITLADLASGQSYRIDTDPTCPLIHRDGVDAWAAAAGRQSFRTPAAPEADTAVTVTGSAATVTLVLPQQYGAAFG
ncbi:hypothetical protein MYK68_15870 [Gordonia sp. PP30]|uniref:hypothetical protein n=1 Tax=Gordonia sp. PP30 TaxID=2935861 RepID=UPI001FFE71EC|nr:hypothetical protein [Gordonia sp. PP30]UQE74188.1 hypothetical protein MYK68_15870 [Gordonia sp. PP30]